MNKLLLIFILLSFIACHDDQKENQIKSEIKPFIDKIIIADRLKCELSFIKIHENDLSIVCLPVDQADPQMVNQLRTEVTKITSVWAESNGHKFTSIRTRFSDEISDPIKK